MTLCEKMQWPVIRKFSLIVGSLVVLSGNAPSSISQSAQTIVAVVNDEIISNFDLEQRIRLVLSSSGAKATAQQKNQLKSQVLTGLVDERLQIQEARRLNIDVRDDEIDGAVSIIENQNGMKEGDLARALESQGASLATLHDQLRAQIAWSKIVSRRLRPRVVVGDGEIDTHLARLEKTGQVEHLTSVIFLAINDQNAAVREDVVANAQKLITQFRRGTSFSILARQFSQSVSASSGGDLGWITSAELPQAPGTALETLAVNEVSSPISTRDGVYILRVKERRRFASVDPAQVTVTLKQIFIPLKSNADDDSIGSQMALAATIEGTVRGCEDFDTLAQEMGSQKSGHLGEVKISNTPAQFRETILALEVGDPSKPVRTETGIHVFMICDREQPAVPVPDRGAIENSIGQARLSMLARRYLRNLRRDALVDVR